MSKSESLKDDLAFLTERGDRLADRLDTLVRAAQPLAQDRKDDKPQTRAPTNQTGTTKVERDLLAALRMAR